MADQVVEMGGEIHQGETVSEIVSSDNGITSISTVDASGNKKQYEGDYYLSSMPIKDLVSAMDGVPKDIYTTATTLPYRDFITVGLLVKKLKLKNKTKIKTVGNIVPDCWIYIQERDVNIGRLQIFNNWSPYMVKDFENTVWIGLEYFCSEGDKLWSMNDEDFIQMAIGELVKIDIIDQEDVLDSTRIRVQKAYPAYFGSYDSFPKVQDYLDSFVNLYCIGRNGQHRYNNMDHSMLTAIEAVRSIQEGKHSTKPVWNVNTEVEYHEEEKTN
jgi:protoporphyrinogen oxidase